ncbi:MAG: NAD(P)/FAD-dependent oxidoreductase [Candidatus Hodarchaeota archaeon]
MHDLIVVGGGPAGSTCARRAAQAGLDVLLLEKTRFPRYKLCGGALTQRVLETLDFDLGPAVEREVGGGKVFSSLGRCLSIAFESFTGYLVKRSRFDQLLLDKAKEAGATVIEETQAVAIEQIQRGIRVLTHGDSHKGHLLVGADGVNSLVARCSGIRKRWRPENVGLCISADVLVSPSDIEHAFTNEATGEIGVELYFGEIEWGFGWCFPRKEDLSIGIGCRLDKARNLKSSWREFVKKIEDTKGFCFDHAKWNSWRVPIGGARARCTSRRTMLIGDAAGLVSPITGEGIFYAIESGILAANIAKETVQMKSPVHSRTFDERVRYLTDDLKAARKIAGYLYKSANNADLLLQIAEEDTVMKGYIMDFVTGEGSFLKLRSALMKRLLLRHPVKAVRLGL